MTTLKRSSQMGAVKHLASPLDPSAAGELDEAVSYEHRAAADFGRGVLTTALLAIALGRATNVVALKILWKAQEPLQPQPLESQGQLAPQLAPPAQVEALVKAPLQIGQAKE